MSETKSKMHWHRFFETRSGVFTAAATVTILIGGLVEIIPMYSVAVDPAQAALVAEYTPLELAGRDIYVREGCYNCHSQMVRPMYAESLRYGPWSRSAEYVHDRPFQLGSRRIGPDLARAGGTRSNAWHYDHFRDPRALTPGSIMPAYSWLHTSSISVADIQASLRAHQRLGTDYTDADIENAGALMQAQGEAIVADLVASGITDSAWDREIIAMIAYMQRLGTSIDLLLPREDDAEGAAAAPAAAAYGEEG
jgi:cytochrome c oxidase cbb3-type subunit I/II